MENPIEVWQEVLRNPGLLLFSLLALVIAGGGLVLFNKYETTITSALSSWPAVVRWPVALVGILLLGYGLILAVGSFFIVLWVIGPIALAAYGAWWFLGTQGTAPDLRLGSTDHLNQAQLYCDCMEELKTRVAYVRSVLGGEHQFPSELFAYESVSLHLRKILELIAFASLTANREQYANAHSRFRSHWNAKRLLDNLGELHPSFYPQPIRHAGTNDAGQHNFEPLHDGFLTQDEFVTLYDKCSSVLHTWNPYRDGPRVVDFGYAPMEWVERIQLLLGLHKMTLSGSDSIWIVQMNHPDDGKVHALTADPIT